MRIAFPLFDAVADPNSSPALEWTTRIGCVSRNGIGLRHAPCDTQTGHQRTELGDRRVDTLAEFARLESTDSAISNASQSSALPPCRATVTWRDGQGALRSVTFYRC